MICKLAIKVIENLPKCYNCSNIATRYGEYQEYNKIDEYYYTAKKYACDVCCPYMSELSYASSLREYQLILKGNYD